MMNYFNAINSLQVTAIFAQQNFSNDVASIIDAGKESTDQENSF